MVVDQEEIHRLCLSENRKDRLKSLILLKDEFGSLPDKPAAWYDLHMLTTDKDIYVKTKATSTLGSVFKYVPEELKPEAWDDLIRPLNDEEAYVIREAGVAIEYAFKYVPDKPTAWFDLIKLIGKEDSDVRRVAVSALGSAFEYVTDKSDAWTNLIKITRDEDFKLRRNAVFVLFVVIECVPDKYIAWSDLIRLILNEDMFVRAFMSELLGYAFEYVPDKSDAWNDLIKLTSNGDYSDVGRIAVSALGSAFEYVPDKPDAWNDIIRLTTDKNEDVRCSAASALCSAFEYVPNKPDAWNDLHCLTSDKDSFIRKGYAYGLSDAFQFVPAEFEYDVMDDLHRLISDDDSDVRFAIASTLGSIFKYVSDEFKPDIWNGLHNLTTDEDSNVRGTAIDSLYEAFDYIPNKSVALSDLVLLTYDKDSFIRIRAAFALGSVFRYVPDNYDSLNDLIRLTMDEESCIRMYANYSLGKICIYEASKSIIESEAQKLLEEAIGYFEKAANEKEYSNPAIFCSLFYQMFDAVLFRKVHSKKEIEGYIAAARKEIGISESKQKLIEAIEQLAEAIEIAYNACESGCNWQETLNCCSDICNHAEQLMDKNKEKTPDLHDLYQLAKPSFRKKIKELIDEVKEKAEIACKEAKGTPAEPITCLVNTEIQGWRVENQVQMAMNLDLVILSLKTQVPNIPGNKDILDKINEIKSHSEVEFQMAILATVISLLPTISIAEKTYEIATQINEKTTRIENKVDSILKTITELKNLSSKLKEEGNNKGSQDVNDIAEKIKILFENGNPKDITLFIEKLREKAPIILKEIENVQDSYDAKEKAQKGLKENIMKIGKDISFAVATNWIATYLPSIVAAGASGLIVLGIILAFLVSIESMSDQGKK
jgi:HEAT repeat protein